MKKPGQSILEAVREKIKQLKEKKRQYWKPQIPGKNLVRFLHWDDTGAWFFEDVIHFIPWGGQSGKGISLGCLEPRGVECDGCKTSNKMMESDDAKENELGKQIQAKSRYYYNLVDLAHPENGVQVWANWADTVMGDLCGMYADGEVGDFANPKTGRNVVIDVEGTDKHPKYKLQPKMSASRLEHMEWVTQSKKKPLSKQAAPVDARMMRQLMAQYAGATGGEEEEDPALSLPCFGKEYKKLPACPKCPVKMRCRKIYKAKRMQKLKAKAMVGIKKKVGAA